MSTINISTMSSEPNPTENSDPAWQSFKLSRSIRQVNGMEHDFHLLKDNKSSILGDICIRIGDDKYLFDRLVLATKSSHLRDLILSQLDLNEIKIDSFVKRDTSLSHLILDVIYGKDVKCVLNEDNFVKILDYMVIFEMEIDLGIFEQFIEETIKPQAELNLYMFKLLDFILESSPVLDYLLKIASQYFSRRLLEIFKIEEFLSLSTDGFISILLHKSDNQLEKRMIGRVCAEWVCYDYENRIETLKDLVNATKYRFDFLQYCHCDPLQITTLLKNHPSNKPDDVSLVEKYFNELLLHLGETKFDIPTELSDKLNSMQSGGRVVMPKDQTVEWVLLLEDEIFCDVAINVLGSTFKLHRIKLCSVSGYFYNLFTNPSELLAFEVDNSNEMKIYNHELDEIDSETFRSVVQYIYKQEIEVTSKNQLISLLRGSRFLKMNELFEKCVSELLKLIDYDFSAEIIEIFHYVFENKKYSELYDATVERIIGLWPKLDKIPQFLNISLHMLMEIVAQPGLEIDNTDQVLDLCSKWIFHDIENRYKFTIEVAKAINRNFTMYTEHLKLEIPENSIDYSQEYVKRQLIMILSSSVIVPEENKNVQKDEHKPCFLSLNKEKSLCVMDANFNEIIQLSGVYEKAPFASSATTIDNKLFLLFRNHHSEFYFQLYHSSSKTMISLATDARMSKLKNFEIFACKDEVYFCSDGIILKYSIQLNRWISFLKDDEQGDKQYTSDGGKLYKMLSNYNEETNKWENKTIYYDFERKGWIALPNFPIETVSIKYGKVNVINRELSVLLGSNTFSFNWVTQKWTSVSNCSKKLTNFTADGQNILYVSDENELHLYSPALNEWMLQRKFDVCGSVNTIHKIDK